MKKIIGACVAICLGFGLLLSGVSADDNDPGITPYCSSPSCWVIM